MNNYKCTIETQLRSFYFKVFHDIIGLNAFLFKIKRIEDPKCKFCTQEPETAFHLFVKCPRTLPLWQKLFDFIAEKTKKVYTFSQFNMMFGIDSDTEFSTCINFLFLCLKFYILQM